MPCAVATRMSGAPMTADNRQYAATVLLEDVTWRLDRAMRWIYPELSKMTLLELVDEVEEQLWRLRDLEK